MKRDDLIVNFDDIILITGANGFIGTKVVDSLLQYGFKKIRCFVRPTGNMTNLEEIITGYGNSKVEVLKGNLLSRDDCKRATEGARIIIHLAAGVGKSFPVCVLNSVVTTRNLLDSVLEKKLIRRFLNVSSFAVYDPSNLKRGEILDETCAVITRPEERGEAYCYGKVKQDELVMEYHRNYDIPFAIVRPGTVYGPGKNAITGRVGIDTFGIYFHMGGTNQIPFTYVENCADAIVYSSLIKGIDGEVFNIVDDDLPRSCDFLSAYGKNVKKFRFINIHHKLSYVMSCLWEKYSNWSDGQLPPAFNRSRWTAEWKGHRYSNEKLKRRTGWKPKVSLHEAMSKYFEFCKAAGGI